MDDLISAVITIVLIASIIAGVLLFGGIMLTLILGAIVLGLCAALLKGLGDWVITLFHGRKTKPEIKNEVEIIDAEFTVKEDE